MNSGAIALLRPFRYLKKSGHFAEYGDAVANYCENNRNSIHNGARALFTHHCLDLVLAGLADGATNVFPVGLDA
jgi:predicted component of type VI protein secretion system